VIEGQGHRGDGLDAVHAEDMSLVEIGDGAYRMHRKRRHRNLTGAESCLRPGTVRGLARSKRRGSRSLE